MNINDDLKSSYCMGNLDGPVNTLQHQRVLHRSLENSAKSFWSRPELNGANFRKNRGWVSRICWRNTLTLEKIGWVAKFSLPVGFFAIPSLNYFLNPHPGHTERNADADSLATEINNKMRNDNTTL